MSKVSSNHSQKPPTASAPNKDSRPGWSEIIVGLVVLAIAAEVFRRSGSVWSAVIVHVIVNLPTVPVMVFASMG